MGGFSFTELRAGGGNCITNADVRSLASAFSRTVSIDKALLRRDRTCICLGGGLAASYQAERIGRGLIKRAAIDLLSNNDLIASIPSRTTEF